MQFELFKLISSSYRLPSFYYTINNVFIVYGRHYEKGLIITFLIKKIYIGII